MKKIAIVTGASSGFGKEITRLLYNRQSFDEIWAIARDPKKLSDLQEEFGSVIHPYPMDVSDRSALAEFEAFLQTQKPDIFYLVNNAGYDKFAAYDDLSVTESLNMVDVNVNGVIAMGLLCLPYMKQGSHILNIASIASFQPLPYMNLYSASKAFVRNYTRALNVELKDRGISATAVCPGWMSTALFDRANIGASKTATHFRNLTTPDLVARKALTDADKGKDISVYSFYNKLTHAAAKILPQQLMMKFWMIQQHF